MMNERKFTPRAEEALRLGNGKRTVLIAVNTAKAAVKAALPAIPGKNLTELFADNAKVAVKGGVAEFDIPAETTRIFEIK